MVGQSALDNESSEEIEEEHSTGKKKYISIPLQFKPIETLRGPPSSRGRQRRGGGVRYPSNRDEQQTRKFSRLPFKNNLHDMMFFF